MDGTLYLGNRLYDFTLELLDTLKSTGRRYLFMTNNSSKSVADYIKKLEKMGISAIAFNPFIPIYSTIMNNRDHRKLMIVDGKIGYTGGINLLKVAAQDPNLVLSGAVFELYRPATQEEVGANDPGLKELKGVVGKVMKVSFFDNAALQGAKVTSVTSDENGKAVFYGLAYGNLYVKNGTGHGRSNLFAACGRSSRSGGFVSSENCLCTCYKLLGIKRFFEIIISTQLKAEHFVEYFSFRRKDYYRSGVFLSYLSAYLISVNSRKHKIQKYKVRIKIFHFI